MRHHRGVLVLGPVLAWLVSAAHAQESPARLGSGPAAVLALGYPAGGGMGMAISYYQRLGPTPLYLAPRLGGGVHGFSLPDRRALGWSAGLLAAWGQRHRVVLTADYGVIRQDALHLHGSLIAFSPVLGPQVGLGYEWIRHTGLVVQLVPAIAYPTHGTLSGYQRKIDYTLNVAAGWKAW